jgi:hypothetical protein
MLGENFDANVHDGHSAPKTPDLPADKPSDSVIDQVRELLFGSARRDSDKRIQELQDSVDALRADMMALFADIEGRMADGEAALERRHAVAAQGIGSAVAELGAQLLKLSMPASK